MTGEHCKYGYVQIRLFQECQSSNILLKSLVQNDYTSGSLFRFAFIYTPFVLIVEKRFGFDMIFVRNVSNSINKLWKSLLRCTQISGNVYFNTLNSIKYLGTVLPTMAQPDNCKFIKH